MKPPLIFKGDARYTYASGVIRGLELYLLTKSDYQKIIDADINQLTTVLSELGYGGGEHHPEHALDIATDNLFALIDKLSQDRIFTDAIKLRYDFQKAGVILKSRFFEKPLPELPLWGMLPDDELISGVESILNGEKSNLPDVLVDGILSARKTFSTYNSSNAIEIALDSEYCKHLQSVIPEGEFFQRWMRIYADWLNVKAFVRISLADMQMKVFREFFVECGDIPGKKFAEAEELGAEHFSSVFSNTEYGKELSDALKKAVDKNLSAIDTLFRIKLISLYKYTKYCPYGLELLWSYSLLKMEEIGVLRTILRTKLADIPIDFAREVISIVVE